MVPLNWTYHNTPNSTALVVHGLNLNPKRMDPLAQLLHKKHGMSTLTASLAGHREDPSLFKKITPEIWQEEYKVYFKEARNYADKLGTPLTLLGYSLGGLLIVDHLLRNPKTNVDKIILFAPAIAYRWYSFFLRSLFFLPGHFKIPSQNLKDYYAQNFTSMAAYRTMFRLVDELSLERLEHCPVPMITFFDPKDELVDTFALEKILAAKPCSRLVKLEVKNIENSKLLHHLIIDGKATGEAVWEEVTDQIDQFLKL